MTMHSEAVALQEQFDADIESGARVYLKAGPAQLSELVRVLSQHVGSTNRDRVVGSIMALVADDKLSYSASAMVSLPAGSGKRESEERR